MILNGAKIPCQPKIKHLLWVPLQHLQGLLKSLDNLVEGSASLRELLWLAKRVQNRLILVDLLVELGLELLLRHSDHEVSNQLGDRFTHRPDRDLKHGVDTGANLLDEDVGAASIGLLLGLGRCLSGRNDLAVLVVLGRHVVFIRYDRSAVLFVVSVVDEHVVLLRVDNSFDEFTSVVTLSLEDLTDNIHDLGAEAGASHEDTLDDARGKSFKLSVTVLDQLKSGVAKLVKLRRDQVLKDVNGGEAWNAVTFVHGDGTLDCHIGVLLSCVEVLEVGIKTVELHLNPRTGRELGLLRNSYVLGASLHVKLTRDLVFEGLNELSDHGPDHVELLTLGIWHGLTQVVKFALSLLQFLADLIHDFRQAVPNVSEQYPCQLRRKHFAAKEARWHCRVNLVRIEESHFLLHSSLDGDLSLNVLLRSVFDADESKAQLDFLIHDHALGVCAPIHDINLRDDTHGPDSLGVDSTGHTETLLGGHICVSGDNTKNDGSRVGHVSLAHSTGDLLNVIGLALNGDQCDTWQINQSEIRARVRVYVQHDGVIYDVGT